MSSEKRILNPCRIVAIVLPILGITLFGLWWIRDNDSQHVSFTNIVTANVTQTHEQPRKHKSESSFENFNRKWHR